LAHSLTPSDKGPLVQRESVYRTQHYTTAGRRGCQLKISPCLEGLNEASLRTPVLTDPKGRGSSFAIVRKQGPKTELVANPGLLIGVIGCPALVVQTVSVPTFTWSMAGSMVVKLSSPHAPQMALVTPALSQAILSARSTRPFRVCFSDLSISALSVLPDEPMSP
jgi:hypothetical protein